MVKSDIVNKIMFDYESETKIQDLLKQLDRKTIRWLGTNHPDNKTRKLIFRFSGLKIGEDTVINPYCSFSDAYKNNIIIGKRCAISPFVNFVSDSGPNNSNLQYYEYVKEKLLINKAINIEDDVWIGTNATILPGVTIGKGSIIGANSVVSKDIPPGVIATGCPAKITRKL